MKRLFLAILLACGASNALAAPAPTSPDLMNWPSIVQQAHGETVYFNAWGGDPQVNAYIQWASGVLKQRYDITLKQVKVANIAETTQRLLAEKESGKNTNGSVDMVWINGANFAAMKKNHLLYGPFVDHLPNWKKVDKALPVTRDFSVPTDGLEAPWGVGQLVFIYDTEALKTPPHNFQQLLALAKAHPGQITYPQPPNFYGTSFITSALIALTHDPKALTQPINPVTQAKQFQEVTAPLWNYLNKLNAVAWQKGQRFPANSAETIQLLNNRQILMAITFNPNSIKLAIDNGNLPTTAKAFAFKQGALSNVHFMGIPWNSSAKSAALVTINFMMSPEAQERKSKALVWGDPSVLSPQYLPNTSAQGFTLFKSIDEPNPTWQTALNNEWQKRYGH